MYDWTAKKSIVKENKEVVQVLLNEFLSHFEF
jgi:hypothetical protein